MSELLVLGSRGMLGSFFLEYLYSRNVKYHADQTKQDFLDKNNLFSFLNQIKPNLIINFIGYTDVDGCERDYKKAFLVNSTLPKFLAEWQKKNKHCHKIIHLSTDQVYSNSGNNDEESYMPINLYGLSKLLGEYELLSNNYIGFKNVIFRTNFFGKSISNKKSFTDWIYSMLIKNEKFSMFDDIFFSPLSMNTLSDHIFNILNIDCSGVFNVGSSDQISKYDFGELFSSKIGLVDIFFNNVEKKSSNNFFSTTRPKIMSMNSRKYESLVGVKMPNIKNEILRVAREYD